MPPPLLIDLSHTCHTRARTGIQRVARSLHGALGRDAVAVTHDPHAREWRTLRAWETANLLARGAGAKRGARWPLAAQLGGRARRLLGRGQTALPENSGLIVPEVFSPAVARGLPALFGLATGPRVAVFHDAIALRYPEFSPASTVARFPAYLVELLGFDGIAAVSEDSRTSLLDYWRWLGAGRQPPVQAIPLGVDPPARAGRAPASEAGSPVLLSVGTIEGRKNHLALLEACELLWARGRRFTLHLIGLAHTQTGRAATTRIRALQAAGRPLRYDGPVDDDKLAAAYAGCQFTVYPSSIEGFGLPVIESVAHGKPCICSSRGALGESARGGGCIALDLIDPPGLAAAIDRLLAHPGELANLAAAAQRRRVRNWSDYAGDLRAWMGDLPRR